MINQKLIPAIRSIVDCLVRGEYRSLEIDGRCGRLTTAEIDRAISDYGRTLIGIPDHGWELVDSYKINGLECAWGIDVPLWTQEEGRSDLTLSIFASITDCGIVDVKIEDIRVL